MSIHVSGAAPGLSEMLMDVTPEAFPVTISLSERFRTRCVLIERVPPPAKLPSTVSVPYPESAPRLSVPVLRTSRFPASSVDVPARLIVASSSSSPPPPTAICSQFTRSSASKAWVPFETRRTSVPWPPSNVSTALTSPPEIVKVSLPPPSVTEPVTVAPVFAVMADAPLPSRIATLPAAPTDAPDSNVTLAVPPASVEIAACPAPVPPVTVPVTFTVTSPPSLTA